MNYKPFFIAALLLTITGFVAFTPSAERAVVRKNFTRTNPTGVVYVIVDKSDYELQIYDEEGWYATYPVVFGSKDLSDKMMEGDRKTPEGSFRIVSKKPHQKWHKMLMLDYPNKDSWDKFNQRRNNGQIPRSAGIGGGIAIHGTWPNDNIVVDGFTNWTNGCVSLKNEDLDELDEFLPIGTKVIIRR
ncbi:MAG: L,D-transpeptidase [Candidatus Pseudobacter hemicellulosilyticus]|uniref:L,D-transpeptidase n=1 Tax=Candidatus Pseudobacter hemicellulosilyticus TaxID=3121375 RepID=A0AAJ6BGE6_9BACT|nr:MAG: L,D-transpeptidase [Pseudobacter sp.]